MCESAGENQAVVPRQFGFLVPDEVRFLLQDRAEYVVGVPVTIRAWKHDHRESQIVASGAVWTRNSTICDPRTALTPC